MQNVVIVMIYKDFPCPQVHWPKISYRSKVMVFWLIKFSTSAFISVGRILIRVLEANLYFARFLWSPISKIVDTFKNCAF